MSLCFSELSFNTLQNQNTREKTLTLLQNQITRKKTLTLLQNQNTREQTLTLLQNQNTREQTLTLVTISLFNSRDNKEAVHLQGLHHNLTLLASNKICDLKKKITCCFEKEDRSWWSLQDKCEALVLMQDIASHQQQHPWVVSFAPQKNKEFPLVLLPRLEVSWGVVVTTSSAPKK
jgi:hypothetical protein